MKIFGSIILAHHPGGRLAHFRNRTLRSGDNLRIELLCNWIASFNSFFYLQERVLHVTRAIFIQEILRDVVVRQATAEPGQVPGEKRNNDEERRDDNKPDV